MSECEIHACDRPGDIKISFADEDDGGFCKTHATRGIDREILDGNATAVDLEVPGADD